MKRAAVELADPGVVVVTDNGTTVGPSPGVALLDGGTPVVGMAAAAQRRLHPRRIHDRFWELLDNEPLARPHPDHLRTADLAHAHLAELRGQVGGTLDAVVLAVPATVQRARLGLLIGVAEAAGFPVRGIVDSAVAAAVTETRSAGTLIHLDLLLHRVVGTQLVLDSGVLSRVRVATDDAVGLTGLRDIWARAVAHRFVTATRFDPLKLAVTEQELYDRLSDWLDQLAATGTIRVPMVAGGRQYEVELSSGELEESGRDEVRRVEALVSQLSRAGEVAVVMTPRVARVPGLIRRLETVFGGPIRRLPSLAAASGALARATEIMTGPGEMTLVTRLEVGEGPPPAPPTSPPPDVGTDRGPSATHITYLGRAYQISADPLVVGRATAGPGRGLDLGGTTAGISRSHCTIVMERGRAVVVDHSSYGTYLNGSRIEGRAPLVAGDCLRLGSPGVELQAIKVEGGGEE